MTWVSDVGLNAQIPPSLHLFSETGLLRFWEAPSPELGMQTMLSE